ncbi:MAG: hypothetical protein ACRDL3_00535 [Solirubrobacterales bacterium]
MGTTGSPSEGQTASDKAFDALALQRVLRVFEDNYSLSSADFYRAHMDDEPPAADLSPWHREIWSGTYRQWLRDQGAEDAWRLDHTRVSA